MTGADHSALEIELLWGSTVIDVFGSEAEEIVVGDGTRLIGRGIFATEQPCDLVVPSRGLPAKCFPIAQRAARGGWSITLHARFTGRVRDAGGRISSLHDALSAAPDVSPGPLPETWRWPLPRGAVVWIEHDALTLRIRAVDVERAPVAPLAQRIQPAWASALLAAGAVHLSLLLAIFAVRGAPPSIEAPVLSRNAPDVRYLPPEPGPPKKLAAQHSGEPELGPRRAEGASGHDVTPPVQGRGVRRTRPARDHRATAEQAISALLAPDSPERGAIFGSGALELQVDTLLGGRARAELGGADGSGFGTRGREQGAEPRLRTLGAGALLRSSEPVALPVLDTPRAGPSIRAGSTRAPENAAPAAEVEASDPIYKAQIGRVVEAHRAQVRYCYERELPRSPELAGRLLLEWVIGPDGQVSSVRTLESTLNHAEVEACILEKVRAWPFPAPEAGVTAIVRHPFVLRLARTL